MSAPAKPAAPSDHFDGTRFRNVPEQPGTRAWDGVKWLLTRKAGPWDEPSTDVPLGPPPPRTVGPGRLRVTFVNHATVLIQLDGLNILTDPIWAERASPVSWAGPRRVRPPGIRFADLPAIDAVLISHNHYDHLCLETLQRLHERDHPGIFIGLKNGPLLSGAGLGPVFELDWWQEQSLSDSVRVTFVPAQHFANRGPFDHNATLWGGFVIQGSAGRVYFAGDTGVGPHFTEIAERLGPPDLAILPIGAFQPPAIMKSVHLSPEEAVAVHQRLRAKKSLAIHFGTFPLGDDGQREPLHRLDPALRRAGLSRDDFWVLGFGEGRDVPATP